MERVKLGLKLKENPQQAEDMYRYICYKKYENVCINKYSMGFLCAETKRWTLLFIDVHKVLSMCQQGKGSDITALHIMQEVAEWRGVSTDQDAQTNKTLAEGEEEMSAWHT